MADDPAPADSDLIQFDLVMLDDGWRNNLPNAEAIARQAAGAAVVAALAHKHAPWLVPIHARPLEISLVLADDTRVRELNKGYRQRDSATNVLSFATFDRIALAEELTQPAPVPLMLGDVVLARETLKREAIEQNKIPENHLVHLVVHGVLHLLGFDHIEDDDAEVMEALETAVLADLGVPDPYASGAAIRAENKAPAVTRW